MIETKALIGIISLTVFMSMLIAVSISLSFKVANLQENIETLYGNQEILKGCIENVSESQNRLDDELSVLIPEIIDAHNLVTEGMVLNDSEIVETSNLFSEAFSNYNNQTILDAFDDCLQATKNRVLIMYPMIKRIYGNVTQQEIDGIEIASFDKDLGLMHTQSIYVSRDFMRLEVFGCGAATFIKSENKFNIEVVRRVLIDINETGDADALM